MFCLYKIRDAVRVSLVQHAKGGESGWRWQAAAVMWLCVCSQGKKVEKKMRENAGQWERAERKTRKNRPWYIKYTKHKIKFRNLVGDGLKTNAKGERFKLGPRIALDKVQGRTAYLSGFYSNWHLLLKQKWGTTFYLSRNKADEKQNYVHTGWIICSC